MSAFKVFVDDNFNYMDADERYEHGSFASSDEAIAACKKIVDQDLHQLLKPGLTGRELYELYVSFGQDPFIRADQRSDDAAAFRAWEYAETRSEELTGGLTVNGPLRS